MSTGSATAARQWRELTAATRHDQPYIRVDRELTDALLENQYVQYALVEIGPGPDPATAPDWLAAANTRYLRIVRVSDALRGALPYQAVDHYAHAMWHRDQTWLMTRPGFTLPEQGRDGGGSRRRRGPDALTIARAADALSECVRSATVGLPEGLGKYERDRMNDVLRFLGCDSDAARARYRPNEPSLGAAAATRQANAAKKQRQRARRARETIVQAERARCEAEVAAGRAVRLGDEIYESTS
jgi:hypothetical protein